MMHSKRRDQLRQRIKKAGLNGFMTTSANDVFYLTGFHSEGCFLLITLKKDLLFVNGLLETQAREGTKHDASLKVTCPQPFLKGMSENITPLHLEKIGYDSEVITLSLAKNLSSIKKVKWIPSEGLVRELRVIKSPEEIYLIRQACRITAKAYTSTIKKIKSGMTEEELMFSLENSFRNLGSARISFPSIVAFNSNSAFPHYVSGKIKLKSGSAVLIDAGSALGHYASDFTRTIAFGKPSKEFQKIHSIVKEAQAAGIAMIKPGVTAEAVDDVCRGIIEKYGYKKYFTHGTGHGLGLDIHENPRLMVGSKEKLVAGMVVTVEPGIYLPGKFGVRIEDTILVTKNGYEILTK